MYKVAGQVPRKEPNGGFKHDQLKEVKKVSVSGDWKKYYSRLDQFKDGLTTSTLVFLIK